jgi:serine/threonine-protein kinase
MVLSQGAQLGPFQIERWLGRGGMGEVYLARDTRLDRQVAIKALPAHLTSDPDRLARLQREAKVLASLNHAGIAAIYGLEEAEGQRYLILEYVEGETLADRLTGGAIPVDEALALGEQIANALEAAHDKGVIHRDLKPGNVMVTPDGVVKVLDFGLARTENGRAPASHGPTDSPTVVSSARGPSPTIPGAIMGSPGYMSPEQALGKMVDKRSDIFAFGCVLYELLAGVQVFPGETTTASLGAILHVDPDWSRLPARTPLRIRELLASTLDKDRKQRLHDIGDARLALEHAIQGREWASVGGRQASEGPRQAIWRALPWTLAATFLVLATGVFWRSWSGPRQDHTGSSRSAPIRLRVDDSEAPPSFKYDTGTLAVTADGEQIAYLSQRAGQGAFVVVRRMDDPHIQRLALSPSISEVDPWYAPSDMTFSPDGTLIAAFGHNSVFSIPVGGGEPTRLYGGPQYVATKGGAWSKDGIIFCPAPNAGLMLISEKGGDPRTLTVPDPARDELSHRWPDVLPGGRWALMTVKKSGILTFDDAEIALLNLETGIWSTIIRGGSYARYAPTGHIVFARNGSIMAVVFDAAAGKVAGTPVAVVPGVMTSPGSGAAQFALARDSGTLVYMPGGVDESRRELVWIDRDGKVEPVGAPVMPYRSARCSPDGGRLAANVFGACDAVFVYDLTKRTNTRITFRGNCGTAMWVPDGSKVAYASDADGPMTFNLVSADGSGSPEKIGERGVNEFTCVAIADDKPRYRVPRRGGHLVPALSQQCTPEAGRIAV